MLFKNKVSICNRLFNANTKPLSEVYKFKIDL